jgi:hypothetical protein
MRLLGYGFYRIKFSKENLRYYGKPIKFGKNPESRPRRSWKPKRNKHNSWRRKED